MCWSSSVSPEACPRDDAPRPVPIGGGRPAGLSGHLDLSSKANGHDRMVQELVDSPAVDRLPSRSHVVAVVPVVVEAVPVALSGASDQLVQS